MDRTYLSASRAQRLETAGDLPSTRDQRAHDAEHRAPATWGWQVTTYLWTKAIGAGALALGGLAHLLGIGLGTVGDYWRQRSGFFGAATTGALLVWDLSAPTGSCYISSARSTSWLVLGSYVLSAFPPCSCCGCSRRYSTWVADDAARPLARGPGRSADRRYTAFPVRTGRGPRPVAVPAAVLSTFVQAAMVGSGALALAGTIVGLHDNARTLLAASFVTATLLHLLMLTAEYTGGHASRQAGVAAHIITHGRYARTFWLGGVLPAAVAALLGALTWGGATTVLLASAGVLVQPALLAYESVFVRAGQDVPLS